MRIGWISGAALAVFVPSLAIYWGVNRLQEPADPTDLPAPRRYAQEEAIIPVEVPIADVEDSIARKRIEQAVARFQGPGCILRATNDIAPTVYRRVVQYLYWNGENWTGCEGESQIFSDQRAAEEAKASMETPSGWKSVEVVSSTVLK